MPKKSLSNKIVLSSQTSSVGDVNCAVGSNIRLTRLLKGWTQAQLGDHVGLSFQQVQKYELGASQISIQWLYKFAIALGVEPYDLLPESQQNVSRSFGRSNLGLMKAFQRINSEEVRRKLVEVAKVLADFKE